MRGEQAAVDEVPGRLYANQDVAIGVPELRREPAAIDVGLVDWCHVGCWRLIGMRSFSLDR